MTRRESWFFWGWERGQNRIYFIGFKRGWERWEERAYILLEFGRGLRGVGVADRGNEKFQKMRRLWTDV